VNLALATTKPNPVTIGVDVGGTKVASGIVDSSGRILFQTRLPMMPSSDAQTALQAVERAIEEAGNACCERGLPIAGIGICAPGPLDPSTGVILNPPNLPCWRNFSLGSAVQARFSLPVRVENDANAAALAEAIWGAGAGYRTVFYTTLGTGIGTGFILNQRIYHGRTGSAAEGGHLTIDYRGPQCQCGKRGCIEAYCSGPAIAQRARRLHEFGGHSLLLSLAGGEIQQVRAESVGEAFRLGDALARAVLEETAALLAIWLGNIIDLLEPDVLIFGGGLSQLMSNFFADIRGQLPRCSLNQHAAEIPLLRASYGADAGIAGAAALFAGVAAGTQTITNPEKTLQ
jgi:glucokinase